MRQWQFGRQNTAEFEFAENKNIVKNGCYDHKRFLIKYLREKMFSSSDKKHIRACELHISPLVNIFQCQVRRQRSS